MTSSTDFYLVGYRLSPMETDYE